MARLYRERHPGSVEPSVSSESWVRSLLEDEPGGSVAGECSPAMDVLETEKTIQIVVDLPGIPIQGVRVILAQGTLIVAGRKLPSACAHREAAFLLAERRFGRFVRAVRLTGAVDAGRASATLARGELRVLLPRIEERRGRDIRIPISRPE